MEISNVLKFILQIRVSCFGLLSIELRFHETSEERLSRNLISIPLIVLGHKLYKLLIVSLTGFTVGLLDTFDVLCVLSQLLPVILFLNC
jgi:hypothetical protein